MIFKNPYWSDVLKVNSLERWIIVHSILYYERDESFISDFMFDANCKQLVELREVMGEKEFGKTKYAYAFIKFDGSTGFFLYKALNAEDKQWLNREADNALRFRGSGQCKKEARNSTGKTKKRL